MEEYVLGTMETRFAEMIWEAAPITTGELIKRCDAAFGWKRTTTYTMLEASVRPGVVPTAGWSCYRSGYAVGVPGSPQRAVCGGDLRWLVACVDCHLYAESPPVQAGGGRHPTSDRRKQEGRELI